MTNKNNVICSVSIDTSHLEKTFSEIITQESPKVLMRTLRLVKSKHVAEEILQEAFLDTWLKIQELKTNDDIINYMYSRAYYKSLDYLKSNILPTIQIDEITQQFKDFNSDTESRYEAEEITLQILLQVSKMPEQRQKIFNMSRLEGMSRSEIAKKLNIEPRTVSNHLTNALNDLKKLILLILLWMWH